MTAQDRARRLRAVERAVSHASVFLIGWLVAALTFTRGLPGAALWQRLVDQGLVVDLWDLHLGAAVEVVVPGLVFAVAVFGLDLAVQRRGYA